MIEMVLFHHHSSIQDEGWSKVGCAQTLVLYTTLVPRRSGAGRGYEFSNSNSLQMRYDYYDIIYCFIIIIILLGLCNFQTPNE